MSEFENSITNLSINGMDGRMLYLKSPQPTDKEILLIYGHHASIERMAGFAQYMSRFGNVTICDLPGFGGMDSFYDINMSPDLDNYADYLASFIKIKYKNKKFSVVAMSFSFLILTRMLQKYPKITKQMDDIFSFVGFTHYQDFRLKKSYKRAIKLTAKTFSGSVSSTIFRYTFLLSPVISLTYLAVSRKHAKMSGAGFAELKRRIKAEVKLWQINDVRTRMSTILIMFSVDLCKYNQRVNHKVHHIYVKNDVYVDQYMTEQHMNVIYDDYEAIESPMTNHMPSIVADAEEASLFIPPAVVEKLSK